MESQQSLSPDRQSRVKAAKHPKKKRNDESDGYSERKEAVL